MSAVCRILWDGPADPAADSSTATLEKEAHDEDAMREYTTDPELILERHNHLVDLVVDGGMGNLEASTVLDCTGSEPEVLREGLGPVDDLF